MRLNYKLVLAFASIAILIGVSGYLGATELTSLTSLYYRLQNERIPAILSLNEMRVTLPIIELEPSEYIAKPDEEHTEELDEAEEHVESTLLRYGSAEGNEKAVNLKQDFDELFTLSRGIISLKDSGATPEVLEQEFGILDDKLDVLDEKLDAEKDRIAQEMKVLADDVQNDILFILDLTIILTSLAAGIAVALGVYMSGSVSKPITRLKEAVDQIARGNFDATTNVSNSRDEIGQLCVHLGKMKEELKNKEKMQNEFVSIASHELRTPVQSILGFARLAEGEKTKVDQALKVIVAEAKRLESLTNDILDVSRLDSDNIAYDMDGVAINDLITELAKAFSVSIPGNVKLHMTLDKRCPTVHADKTRINQVLSNVLGNAVKFTTKGEINVETAYLEENGQVRVRIADTGRGIPADLIPKLFSKFVTQDVKNENRQGTGLGLYISKAIVIAHGGEIFAENNENGVGARFTILLPVHTLGSKHGNAANNKVAASS